MKRTDSRLRLRRETLQFLATSALAFVQGGLASQVPVQDTVVRRRMRAQWGRRSKRRQGPQGQQGQQGQEAR